MKPSNSWSQPLPTDQRLTLTIPEACQALGIGETMLRQMIRDRQLPILRLGRRVLVPRQAVEGLVAGVCEESQSSVDLDSTKR
jgi:excisionase family DNA binding protein